MRHRTVLLIALLALAPILDVPASPDDESYFACFDFASLVTGGTIQPGWLDDGSVWWKEGDEIRAVTSDGRSFDPEPGLIPEAVSAADEEAPAPDTEVTETLPGPGKQSALIIADNLWLEDDDGDRVQLTEDGNESRPWVLWGGSWSPDGRYLVLTRFDLTRSPSIPIVDWLDPAAPVKREPATQADEPRMTGELQILRVEDARMLAVQEDTEIPEPLWHVAGWVPESGELLALRFNRVMNRQDLLAIDPDTGAHRTLIAERSQTFIDGLAAAFMMDDYVSPVGDGEHFVWLSERDGFHHLYLYRYDGKLVRRLTRGEFPVVKVEGIDVDRRWVYFSAKPDRQDPTSRHLCRVDLKGKRFRQLTALPGRRTIQLSPDFNLFVENHSDLDRPPRATLRRTDGTFVADLSKADTSGLEGMGWTPPTRAMAKAADGESDCFCAIYLPPGFDPELRYPVIEVIYAGPQWMIVPRRMPAGEYGDTAAALARLGYVTVIVDSPGTAGIGRAYQDAVFGRLGQIEIADHVAAIRGLAADRPWMDLDRVGVHGKSWGGYFTLNAMLKAPDFYKVGVASAVVADLATAPDSPIVPYMGRPSENPEGYAAADLPALADRLAGDLLITIGTSDQNTHFGHTMRVTHAFIEAGRDVDLLVLPGQHHWLQGASFARWQRALRDHFLEHLPPLALPRD